MSLKQRQNKEELEIFKIFNDLQNKNPLIIASIITLICTIFALLYNYCFGCSIISLNQSKFSQENFLFYFLGTLMISILLAILNTINYKTKQKANTELIQNLRNSFYKQKFPNETQNYISVLTNDRLFQDVNAISTNYLDQILQIDEYITNSICCIILACLTNWQLSVPISIILIVLFFVYYFNDSKNNRNSIILFSNDEEDLFNDKIAKKENARTTKIILANRLDTISNVDKIIVINNGNAEVEGKHNELINTNEFYTNLIKFQFSRT